MTHLAGHQWLPVSDRIKDVKTARRCIRAIVAFLERHESPLAGVDLKEAVRVIEREATKQTRTEAKT